MAASFLSLSCLSTLDACWLGWYVYIVEPRKSNYLVRHTLWAKRNNSNERMEQIVSLNEMMIRAALIWMDKLFCFLQSQIVGLKSNRVNVNVVSCVHMCTKVGGAT